MSNRILIGSPVRRNVQILSEFLRGLSELKTELSDVEFLFVDDNVSAQSSELLRQFQRTHPRTTIHAAENTGGPYVCDDSQHHWNHALIWRVAHLKDRIIREALERNVDSLFLVDSDVVLPPPLLDHLVSLNKPVVSEVYWTSWNPGQPMLPQVWLHDVYEPFQIASKGNGADDLAGVRATSFLKVLRRPGVHRVGGLGGCTLIARDALTKGLSFSEIDNLSFWGEDRHFCVRARSLGVELWADTRLPPLHVYRDSELERVRAYRARWAANYLQNPKLTLSMIVRDESDRWLRHALRTHRPFIDSAIVVDDASTDGTADMVRRELEGVPLRLVRNETSRFANEVELRKQQWDECVTSNPDWLLVLDADEILEPAAAQVLPELIRQTEYSVIGFRLYDFWDEGHYREDQWWSAHKSAKPFLVRYTPDFLYGWHESAQHCGRVPANIFQLNSASVDLRVKHMGWADERDRQRKYARYKTLDPDARFGIREQYESILDPHPTLVAWEDQR